MGGEEERAGGEGGEMGGDGFQGSAVGLSVSLFLSLALFVSF